MELSKESKKARLDILQMPSLPYDDIFAAIDIALAIVQYKQERDAVFLPHYLKYAALNEIIQFGTSLHYNENMNAAANLATSKKNAKQDGRVFLVLSSYQVFHGDFWTCLLAGKEFKLDNLMVIVDKNSGILHSENLRQIAMYAGWASTCLDGHHIPSLLSAFEWGETLSVPQLLVANTVKGRGEFQDDV